MKLRVLGSHGGEAQYFNATSFLINERLLVDAGSVASRLSVEAQVRIDHALITHPHLDHIKDLGFVADNVFGKRSSPLEVVAPEPVLEDLRRHIFNWVVWPDFSQLPSRDAPTLRWLPIEDSLRLGEFMVECREVNHPGNAYGYVIEDLATDVSVAVSGDTRETDAIWATAFAHDNLKAVFADVSFPNSMAHIAEASGHFTPSSFLREMRKFPRNDVPVYLYHLKPAYHNEVIREIRALDRSDFYIVEQGDEYDFATPRDTAKAGRAAGAR